MSKSSQKEIEARKPLVPSTGCHTVRVNLKSPDQEFVIIAAGDFHVGSSSFNEFAFNTFKNQVKAEAKKHPTYLLLMGDLFDGIAASDKRYTKDTQVGTASEALDLVTAHVKDLEQVPGLHLIGALTGNHEAKFCGGDINLIYGLYRQASDALTPLGFKSFIYFDLIHKGKKIGTLRTVAFHGAKNSCLPQGRARIVREFLKENDLTKDSFLRKTSIVFYGHTHDTRVEEVCSIIAEPRTKRFIHVTQYGCLTGSFHDSANCTENSYAADRGMLPMPVGYIKVTVSTKMATPKVEAITNNGLNPKVSTASWMDV